MKKYIVSNVLFTMLFAALFAPLFFMLTQYVIEYSMPNVAAKQSLRELNVAPVTVERSFKNASDEAKVTVLMYHQIIPKKHMQPHHYNEAGELHDMVVTLEDFTAQMDYLKEENYTVLTLREFEDYMLRGKQVDEKSVLITFDDGYKNVFEFAYPVLKRHQFYATQFIITGLITHRTVDYDSHSLQYASIEEMQAAADVFDYGNHTNNFHQRNEIDVAYLLAHDDETVTEDIGKAYEWLGHTTAFAAPYGEYSTKTLAILRSFNTHIAFTTFPNYAQPEQHALEIPRQGIYPFYTLNDFKYIVQQKRTDPTQTIENWSGV